MSVETKKSFCRFCHANCAIEVDVENNRVLEVRGDAGNPLFKGYTCSKGRQLPAQTHHETRLLSSLKKLPDGSFQEISSQQAFDEIAEKIRHLVDSCGPRALASYCGSGAFQNSTALPLAKAFQVGMGSPSFYSSITIDQPAKVFMWSRFGTWGGGMHSFRDADVMMSLGNNCIVSHFAPPGGASPFNPAHSLREAKARGLRLICVDPRCTEMTRLADIHLQLRPGEDPTLLAGMIRIILEEGLQDKKFCADYLQDLEALEKAVADFSPEYVAQRCDVPAEQVFAAARLFAQGPRGVASSGTGPEMSPRGTLTEHFILTLNAICGRFYREGEVSTIPRVLEPSYPRKAQVKLAAPLWGEGFHKARVRGLTELGKEMPCTTAADEMLLPGEGQIKGLLCIGGNPMLSWPDQEKTFRALTGLELLVCVDIGLTATSKLADYIIAAQTCLEREDATLLSQWWYEDPYACYTESMVAPGGDVVNEWEVSWELARRLDVPLNLPGGPLSFQCKPTTYQVLEMITSGSRVPLAEVRDKTRGEGLVFPEARAIVEPADPGNQTRFQLAPAGVLDEIRSLRAEPLPENGKVIVDGRAYTHLLVPRRLRHCFNTAGKQLDVLKKEGVTNFAHINPEDLRSLQIESDTLIEIRAENDTIIGVALADDNVKRGVISMAYCFGDRDTTRDNVREQGSSVNRLIMTDRYYDPITGMTRLSSIPVNIAAVTN